MFFCCCCFSSVCILFTSVCGFIQALCIYSSKREEQFGTLAKFHPQMKTKENCAPTFIRANFFLFSARRHSLIGRLFFFSLFSFWLPDAWCQQLGRRRHYLLSFTSHGTYVCAPANWWGVCAWFLWGNPLAFHLHRGNNREHNNFPRCSETTVVFLPLLSSHIRSEIIVKKGGREKKEEKKTGFVIWRAFVKKTASCSSGINCIPARKPPAASLTCVFSV